MGTTTLKQLGQLRPADTNAASLYSPGAGEEVTINSLVVSNTSGSAATFRIFLDDNGSTYDETTSLAWDISLPADSIYKHPGVITMNDSTGNLAVRSGTANALTFTAHGSVTT